MDLPTAASTATQWAGHWGFHSVELSDAKRAGRTGPLLALQSGTKRAAVWAIQTAGWMEQLWAAQMESHWAVPTEPL